MKILFFGLDYLTLQQPDYSLKQELVNSIAFTPNFSIMGNLEKEAIRLINQKLKEKTDWNYSVLAAKIGMHPSSVAKMLNSNQIKLDRLKLISELLGYNFLRALADLVEVDDPPRHTMEAATKERLRDLEIENAVLMKVLGK